MYYCINTIYLIAFIVYKMRIFHYLAVAIIFLTGANVFSQPKSWHSTSIQDAWLSCAPSPNPNHARGDGHWLKYDFGQVYRLTTSHFWNFNVPQRTNSYNNEAWSLSPLKGKPEDGVKEIVIDYSFDGLLWREWGRFDLGKASASPFYDGMPGPDLNGLQTRYLLLTMSKNHGGDCYGLSEVRFEVQEAPSNVSEEKAMEQKLIVQPNPFSEECVVTLPGFPEGTVKLRLVDLTGRVLAEREAHSTGGDVSFLWHPGVHPSGLYVLKVLHPSVEASLQVEIIH